MLPKDVGGYDRCEMTPVLFLVKSVLNVDHPLGIGITLHVAGTLREGGVGGLACCSESNTHIGHIEQSLQQQCPTS